MRAGLAAGLHLALRASEAEPTDCPSTFEYHGCAVVDLRCFTEPPVAVQGQLTGESCQFACKDFDIAALYPGICRCSNNTDAVQPLDEAVCTCDCTGQSYGLDSECLATCANKPPGASQVWTRKQLQGAEEPPSSNYPDGSNGEPNPNGRLFPPGGGSTGEPEDVPPEPQSTQPSDAPLTDSTTPDDPPEPQPGTSGQGDAHPPETPDGSVPPEPNTGHGDEPPQVPDDNDLPPATGEGDPPEPSSVPDEPSSPPGTTTWSPPPASNTGGPETTAESSESTSTSAAAGPDTTLWPPTPDIPPPAGGLNSTTLVPPSSDVPSRPAQVPEGDTPAPSVVPESGHARLDVPLLSSWSGLTLVAAMIM